MFVLATVLSTFLFLCCFIFKSNYWEYLKLEWQDWCSVTKLRKCDTNQDKNTKEGKQSSDMFGERHTSPVVTLQPNLSPPKPRTRCSCCPYGYHIDVDFVQYCKKVALTWENGATVNGNSVSERRRNRRREVQSAEFLLGLEDGMLAVEPSKVNSLPRGDVPHVPVELPVLENPGEGLRAAVDNFELTLSRSREKKVLRDVPEPSAVCLKVPRSNFSTMPSTNACAIGSTSADVMEIPSKSVVSTGDLQGMTAEMSRTLQKMRELEEKVKAIPVLQVHLAVLSEEKRQLMDQLRMQDSMDSVSSKLSLKENIQKENYMVEPSNKSPKPRMRDVSTVCKVVTRDVGTSHISPRSRSVAVGTAPTLNKLKCLTIKKVAEESVEPAPATPTVPVRSSSLRIRSYDKSSITDAISSKSISTQTNEEAPAEEIQKPIRKTKDTYIQTDPPKTSSSGVTAAPKIRHVAVGGETRIDRPLPCEKCDVRKKSVATNVSMLPPSPAPPPVVATARIAPITYSKAIDTRDFCRSHDIGVNTQKCKLVDAAAGPRVEVKHVGTMAMALPPPSPVTPDAGFGSTGVRLCDKCNASIQAVAANVFTSGTSPPAPPRSTGGPGAPSRIPRSVSSPETKRHSRPLLRRDTYTKETIENSRNRLPHSLSRGSSRNSSPEKPVASPPKPLSVPEEPTEKPASVPSGDQPYPVHESALFLPISDKPREKGEPSREMKAALKVLNDALTRTGKGVQKTPPASATNIIQKEWFKICGSKNSNAHIVEDYLDVIEEVSKEVLAYVVNLQDVNGNMALHYAVSHGNLDVVSTLLDSQVCNPDRPNKAGYTPIMLVSLSPMKGDIDKHVVRRLFSLGDINGKAKQHGQTSLMLAASHGRLDALKLLLEAGADVNIQDVDGSTALMCASEHGHISVVKYLLSQPDCDPTLPDNDGSTALNVAVEAGHRDIGVLLYAHMTFSRGSSPYASLRMHHRRSSRGSTPRSITPLSPAPRMKKSTST